MEECCIAAGVQAAWRGGAMESTSCVETPFL